MPTTWYTAIVNAACCIWCLDVNGAPSDEHFWPAALGGDAAAILPAGSVCRRCNNALAILDQRLADEFDLFLLDAGVSRRGGKPPAVLNRGNFIGWMGPEGPCIEVNLGPGTVDSDGRRIPPPGRSRRNLRPKITREGATGHVHLSQQFTFDRPFVRALHKIGLGAVCQFHGAAQACDAKYDSVRKFVRNDTGEKRALLIAEPGLPNRFGFDGVYRHEDGGEIAVVRLGPARFVVELGETDAHLLRLQLTADNSGIPTRLLPERR